jgi:hypothetical protein
MISARIMGYGQDYSFMYDDVEYTVDLNQLEHKKIDTSLISPKGTAKFTLPHSENEIEFKFLTEKDSEKITEEIEGYKKLTPNSSSDITTRLKHTIVSINGDTDKNNIKSFVENQLLALDSRALRTHIKSLTPDVNLTFKTNGGDDIDLPIGLTFFWPDLG